MPYFFYSGVDICLYEFELVGVFDSPFLECFPGVFIESPAIARVSVVGAGRGCIDINESTRFQDAAHL